MQSDADFCAFAEQAGFTKGRFEAALPGQLRALQCIIAGVDLLAILPCGGGKTLLFVLPALQHTDGLTVIVSPLIALIEKMVGDLQARVAWPARDGACCTYAVPPAECTSASNPRAYWHSRCKDGAGHCRVTQIPCGLQSGKGTA